MIDKGLYKNGRIQARTGYAGEQYSGGSSNNNNTSGGGDGERDRQVFNAQQYSQPRSVTPKTTSDDPMDIREQYRINPNLVMGGLASGPRAIISPIDRTAADQFSQFTAYGRNRFARNLEPSFTQKLGNAFETLKGVPNAFRTKSLQNLYDQKVGAKRAIPSLANLFSVYSPALSTYEATDPSLDQYGMSGEDLTDIDRLASAIEKSKTQGITQKEFNDAFFGKDNPRNPNNITETGGDGGGINTLQYMLPVAQTQEEIEEPEEMSFYERLRQNLGLV